MEQIIKEAVDAIIAIPSKSQHEIVENPQFKATIEKLSKELAKLSDDKEFFRYVCEFKEQLELSEKVLAMGYKENHDLKDHIRYSIAYIINEDVQTAERRNLLILAITDLDNYMIKEESKKNKVFNGENMEQIIEQAVDKIMDFATHSKTQEEVLMNPKFKEAIQHLSKELAKLSDEDFSKELSNFKNKLESHTTVLVQNIKYQVRNEYKLSEKIELKNYARETIALILIDDVKTQERKSILIEVISDLKKYTQPVKNENTNSFKGK